MEQFLETFFSWQHFKDSLPSVIEGFKTNLSLMFVAEACVLVWGLVLALFRGARSRVAASGLPTALATRRRMAPGTAPASNAPSIVSRCH